MYKNVLLNKIMTSTSESTAVVQSPAVESVNQSRAERPWWIKWLIFGLVFLCLVGLGLGLYFGLGSKKKQVGDDCTDTTECDVGLNCDNKKKCVAPKKSGESCVSGECASGLNCNATSKTCVSSSSLTSKKLGESCATGECAAGLNCNTTSKICENPPPIIKKLNETCESAKNEECATNLFCNSSKICQ